MKKFNQTISSLLILVLILSFKANADEGWWSTSRVAGGSIYSQAEHPEIALEKEVLIYLNDHAQSEVYFLFKNNTEKPVVVDVGFPVKIIIPLQTITHQDFGKSLLTKLYGENIFLGSKEEINRSYFLRANPSIFRTSNRRIMSCEKFDELNRFRASFGGKHQLVDMHISQDDTEVKIDSVVVEAHAMGLDTAVVEFHFHHRLSFQPAGYSTVVVAYTSFSVTVNEGGEGYSGDWNYYTWSYILGTGRTWKGPIARAYVLVPEHLQPDLPVSFSPVGSFKGNSVFVATSYEPAADEGIEIRHAEYDLHQPNWFEPSALIPLVKPRFPSQGFVALKNVSSYLPEKTWVNSILSHAILPHIDPSYAWHNEVRETILSKDEPCVTENVPVEFDGIGFGALSLFDGIPESAWCEGVKGDGINQWVEFELKEDVSGLALYNGFKKISFLVTSDSKSKEELIRTYSKNNRAKLLEFVSSDGRISRHIELKDTPERQSFDDIDLPKGVYKLYIRDIYKGTKYQDTCLGEIEFFSASAKWAIEEDEFLKKALLPFAE